MLAAHQLSDNCLATEASTSLNAVLLFVSTKIHLCRVFQRLILCGKTFHKNKVSNNITVFDDMIEEGWTLKCSLIVVKFNPQPFKHTTLQIFFRIRPSKMNRKRKTAFGTSKNGHRSKPCDKSLKEKLAHIYHCFTKNYKVVDIKRDKYS